MAKNDTLIHSPRVAVFLLMQVCQLAAIFLQRKPYARENLFKHQRFVWTKFVTHEINNGDDSWTLYTIAYVDKMPAYTEYITAAFRCNGIESGNKDRGSRWINCSEILPWVGLVHPGISWYRTSNWSISLHWATHIHHNGLHRQLG